MVYKIIQIEGNDYKIDFTFDDGSKSIQTISFKEIANKEDLELAINDYALAYKRGKEIESVEKFIPSDIQLVIGKAQTITLKSGSQEEVL